MVGCCTGSRLVWRPEYLLDVIGGTPIQVRGCPIRHERPVHGEVFSVHKAPGLVPSAKFDDELSVADAQGVFHRNQRVPAQRLSHCDRTWEISGLRASKSRT